MSKHKAIQGHCLCGAVKITVQDPAGWIGACHCRPCQRASGGLWAAFPAEADTVTITGKAQTYGSSPIATRAFCGTCGTPLWMRDTSADATYHMMPGLFDEAADWPLVSEVYSDEAMCAFALKGDHKTATAQAYRKANPETHEVAR